TLYESEPYDGFFLAKLQNIVTSTNPDLTETAWSIYPNPASRQLHLNLPLTAQAAKAILTDVRGQEVYNASFTSGAGATLNLPALSSGVYVLSVQTEKEVLRKKVVIR
ncbi:MAG: T9SS type A sorting domain-containing protein, partial [Chitinophagaceae bacterium]